MGSDKDSGNTIAIGVDDTLHPSQRHTPPSAATRGRTMTRPEIAIDNSTIGLHHRRVTRSNSHDGMDDHERGYGAGMSSSTAHYTFLQRHTSVKKKRKYSSNNTRSNRKGSTSLLEWVQFCVLAGIPACLILMFLFLNRMNQDRRTVEPFLFDRSQYNSVSAPKIRSLHATLRVDHTLRSVVDQEDHNLQSKTNESSLQKANERRQRTRPPNDDDAHRRMEDWQTTRILSPSEWPRSTTHYVTDDIPRPSLFQPALLEEICGYHAQNVALHAEIGSFTSRDALKMPKERVTRVLITGILSQPAFMLALALKERCNVDVIFGFDAMYPNSLRNRLRLQEQMAILTKFIPRLVRPIFIAHIGIDPLRHAKSFHVLEETLEMDVVQSLTPTHIVHFASYDPAVFRYNDPEWRNTQSPYVHPVPTSTTAAGDDPVDQTTYHHPALYSLRSGLLSMEQLLASIAAAPLNERPHFIYATSTSSSSPATSSRRIDQIMHMSARRMDEVLADFYYQQHGVSSIGFRLPNTILGPWSHPESDLYQLVDQLVREVTFTNTTMNPMVAAALSRPDSQHLDTLHVNDLVDALIAAMQYRPVDSKPALFDLRSGTTISLQHIRDAVRSILDPSSSSIQIAAADGYTNDSDFESNRAALKKAIDWAPRVTLAEGLTRMVAWHMDRVHPYGQPLYTRFNLTLPHVVEPGDSILRRHSFATCDSTDYICHGGRSFLPCASECSTRQKCIQTAFDPLVTMVQDLTEGCDIVVYTYNFDNDATDLQLQSEYIEDSHPQICNFAFVRGNTKLVDNVIQKVPESELGRLGFEMTPEDESQPGGILARKRDKLNARLLYRGWILIWTKDAPEELSTAEKFLLKLSPGKLFHPDVKSAVFIDQGFGVSPRADDILFLVNEMNREPFHARIIKRKNRPKAKFLLPPEPQRKAVILMSELKKQDSSDAVRLSSEEKITTYEATRFMRYSIGEEPLGKEPAEIKLQREFYDRVRATINPDPGRGPSDPIQKFELSHWVRSRWVAHDMVHEESRQLRCEWYQEHVLWESDLDQLSFAYVMQRRELDRKLEHREPDETAKKQLSERTEMKKLLSDTFEWHALKTPQNKLYSPFEEMQILPFDMDNTEERELLHRKIEAKEDGPDIPLFVRIISDRIMAYARKAWSSTKMEEVDEDGTKREL